MIAYEPFGRTGHRSSRAIFGAAALAEVTQTVADKTLDLLLETGINHIDTAASYGDSELRLGPWMVEHRDRFFLATKTEERTYDGAREELERSLQRLKVDNIDLWQMHLLVDAEEWQVAMGPGGALEAFIEAREEGMTRFLGVTGHGLRAPEMHLRSLERFDFDSVLLPYNPALMQNPGYAAGFDALEALCQARNVAIQTIKSIARGRWKEGPRRWSTWYEPLETQKNIDLAVGYVLGRPGLFLNTAADVNLLPMVLSAAGKSGGLAMPHDLAQALDSLRMEPLFT